MRTAASITATVAIVNAIQNMVSPLSRPLTLLGSPHKPSRPNVAERVVDGEQPVTDYREQTGLM